MRNGEKNFGHETERKSEITDESFSVITKTLTLKPDGSSQFCGLSLKCLNYRLVFFPEFNLIMASGLTLTDHFTLVGTFLSKKG